jgi:hypothetical protein
VDDQSFAVIPRRDWDACAWNGIGEMPRPKRIAIWVDIAPDQSAACIAIAGLLDQGPANEDGVLPERTCWLAIGQDDAGWDDHRAGVDWILPRLRELKSRQRVAVIGIDPIGPGSELIPAIENDTALSNVLQTCQLREVAQGHAQFLRGLGVPEGRDTPTPVRTILHSNHRDLTRAVAAAVQRDVGDGQHAWARRDTTEDISPLCAGTMAVWAARKFGRGYDVLNSVF